MVLGRAKSNGMKIEQPMSVAEVAAFGEWLDQPPIWERATHG